VNARVREKCYAIHRGESFSSRRETLDRARISIHSAPTPRGSIRLQSPMRHMSSSARATKQLHNLTFLRLSRIHARTHARTRARARSRVTVRSVAARSRRGVANHARWFLFTSFSPFLSPCHLCLCHADARARSHPATKRGHVRRFGIAPSERAVPLTELRVGQNGETCIPFKRRTVITAAATRPRSGGDARKPPSGVGCRSASPNVASPFGERRYHERRCVGRGIRGSQFADGITLRTLLNVSADAPCSVITERTSYEKLAALFTLFSTDSWRRRYIDVGRHTSMRQVTFRTSSGTYDSITPAV